MIPRSVNIRDRRVRSREHPLLFLSPASSMTETRARVCVARVRNRTARADNNYFRNFLAFRATSPSIRKSYKLDCHIHAQIQNTEGWDPRAVPSHSRRVARQIPFNPP